MNEPEAPDPDDVAEETPEVEWAAQLADVAERAGREGYEDVADTLWHATEYLLNAAAASEGEAE